MANILKTYKKRLSNLTANNRSLLLLRTYTSRFLDVAHLDFLMNKSAFSLIEALLAKKQHIILCPILDSRNEKANKVSTQLKAIQRSAKAIFEESGAKDLMLGYPFVNGQLMDGTLIRCPLLFFPVEIFEDKNHWCLRFLADENISFNKSFLLAFQHFNKANLSEELYEMDFSDFEKDPLLFLTKLYHTLEKENLTLHFNPETFLGEVFLFQNFNQEDYVHQTEIGKLKLQPNAILGLFPQASSYLEPDYDVLLSQSHEQNIEDYFVTPDFIGAETRFNISPFAIDASQERIIREVLAGKSLVVQGPPGSGKSQLICNLIAQSIADGKRVLVVCQKRAALDVVYARLQSINLHEFTALVHDFQTDRNAICRRIDSLIERFDEFKSSNQSLDTQIIEKSFGQAKNELAESITTLETFKNALFDDKICGLPIKELYLSSNPKDTHFIFDDNFLALNFNDYTNFTKKFSHFLAYAPDIDTEKYPLKNRQSFHQFDFSHKKDLLFSLQNIKNLAENWREEARKFTIADFSLAKIQQFAAEKAQIQLLQTELTSLAVFEAFSLLQLKEKPQKTKFDSISNALCRLLEHSEMEVFLATEAIEKFELILAKFTQKAKKGALICFFWKIFNAKETKILKEIFIKNGLKLTFVDAQKLAARIQNRKKADTFIDELKKFHWICYLPNSYVFADYQKWQNEMLQAWKASQSFRKTALATLPLEKDRENFIEKTTNLYLLIDEINTKKQAWENHWSDLMLADFLANQLDFEACKTALEQDFDKICEFDRLIKQFSNVESALLAQVLAFQKEWHKEKSYQIFDNSFRLSWINHIEKLYPILRAVSTQRMNQLQTQMRDANFTMQNYAKEIILTQARKGVYENVKTNRLGNLVAYRDLHHQVKKKRTIWPLRKIIGHFQEEVFQLLPCWLASPESVSAIFQMQTLFDLVIFDEASQCFAERGIPAIFRGKQIVIVGDDQQLQPNDLYSTRLENDDDEENAIPTPELEVVSLLDLGKQFLTQKSLKGHYRSLSLELIAFSNYHFYKSGLEMIPDYFDYLSSSPPIQFVKVNGVWDKSTNMIEAQKVVEIVLDLIAKGKENIGIITFNYKQQSLIEDLLESSAAVLPKDLFVKNIENVQGDERDCIIFSIGYAPDVAGKFRLNFGSLNLAGGENRLNVAVTRAREKIVVVSSILPAQLAVENSTNQGPKLLKAYLEYVISVDNGTFKAKWTFAKGQKPIFKTTAENLVNMPLMDTKQHYSTEIPFSDLAIFEGNLPKILIQTDDNQLFYSSNIKDFFVYKPLLLESKNWAYRYVYARNVWENE